MAPSAVHLRYSREMSPIDVPAEVRVLDDGLVVIVVEDHRTDRVALHLQFGVGSRDEQPGEYGCAHLFEHLMFEGSAHVPENAFDDWLTAGGGDNNAWTSEDGTAYHMTFPVGALDLALFLESDRLGALDAGLTEGAIANQKDVVLQEREEGYGEPNGRDYDALDRIAWPDGHPYAHPVIGTVADVRGFTREAVVGFWRAHYRPRNAVLVLVGDLKPAEAFDRVAHWFSDVPDAGPAPVRAAAPPTPVAVPARRGVIEDDVTERTVYLSYPTVPMGHPDEAALEVLSWVLVNGRGTRLDERLYYSDLATSDEAWSDPRPIAGRFLISASSPKTKLPRLVAAVDDELARISRDPPSPAELERAKDAIRSMVLDYAEGPEGRAELVAECWFRDGRPDCVDAQMAKIAAVTAEDVVRVTETWLVPERRTALSVVPRGDRGALRDSATVVLP